MIDGVEQRDTLAALLHAHWGLRVTSLRAMATGHTNKTYWAWDGVRSVVLRVSWAGKPERQVRDEASVLAWLGTPRNTALEPGCPTALPEMPAVPRLVPTSDGQACLRWNAHWLHVFEAIPGRAGEFGEARMDDSGPSVSISRRAGNSRALSGKADDPRGMTAINTPQTEALSGTVTSPSDGFPPHDRPACGGPERHVPLRTHDDHGPPGPSANADPDVPTASIANAMRTLARLHGALAALATDTQDALAWLRARHTRVSRLPNAAIPSIPEHQYGSVLPSIAGLLSSLDAGIPGPVQWLHGDYHAGNLLLIDQDVSGILDFDDVGQGSPWIEAAFALFALTRDVSREDAFVFDAPAWDAGLRAYAQIRPDVPAAWLQAHRGRLMLLFCADQVLIHLHAARRGLWAPGAGMGFLGCWRQLLAARQPGLPHQLPETGLG
ncbi:phosphotransferase [Bordetella genomosp. 13]|uniref:phosphotransferase n=1 Tax=Bordetella genomosp. 13 TaxID=463040 RepID=UPI00164355FA|nr:phosphotransferase [Bordetella genomosp. 13]